MRLFMPPDDAAARLSRNTMSEFSFRLVYRVSFQQAGKEIIQNANRRVHHQKAITSLNAADE